MKTNFKISIALLALIALLLFSCRKPAATTTQMALFGLHLHTFIDTNLIQPSQVPNVYDQEYPDSLGRYEYLTQANIYISNVSLHSTTKGWYTIPGSILLKRIENEVYTVGNAPADTYDNVQFTIGLGSALDNATAPTSGADSVLSTTKEANMYNGTGNGYYFMNIQGFVDTSVAHDGSKLAAFSYQLGGAGDTVVVSPPTAASGNTFSLLPNLQGAQLVHIIFDYGKLLQTIPPSTINSFTSPAGSATPIFNRLQNHFIRYECTTPNGDC